MRRLTSWCILCAACLALSAAGVGCGEDEVRDTGKGGTGGESTGGSGGESTGGAGGEAMGGAGGEAMGGAGGESTGGAGGEAMGGEAMGGAGGENTGGAGGEATGGAGGEAKGGAGGAAAGGAGGEAEGGAGGQATGGTGGGGSGGDLTSATISGNVWLHPLAASLGNPPSRLGLIVQILDAEKALMNDPDASVGLAVTTDANGSFTLQDVDLSATTLGFVLVVSGVSPGAGFSHSMIPFCMPGATDPAMVCGDRSGQIAFAFPSTLASTLETNMSDPNMVTNGVVLGYVSDGSTAMDGVTIDAGFETVTYLDAALGPIPGGSTTSTNGAFLIRPVQPIFDVTPTKAGFGFVPVTAPGAKAVNVVFQLFFVGAAD